MVIRRRLIALGATLALAYSVVPFTMIAARAQTNPLDAPAREVEPVVLQGAQLPTWSRAAAIGRGDTIIEHRAEPTRDAHNGTLVVPPDARAGLVVDDIAAYKWDGQRFVEVPVQVDERFPYFLSNSRSDSFFGPTYSSTDEELSYEWDVEAWKMTAGECLKEYPEGEGPTEDPVATLDDDDEVVFMASDAGSQAPAGLGPPGVVGDRQEIRLVDPRAPQEQGFVYLFQQEGGSSFDAGSGYVRYERDPNADEWIDRWVFPAGDPENLGSSNTGYGPNLEGTVCHDDVRTTDVVETIRPSTDRFARDGVTVMTSSYEWYASGRWMVRSMQVARPDGGYGPDLIDRWKGRAFQQNPDSQISFVGFEDEQVNWEANSSLLGELQGPVRAIREVWGADSGTNVTKTETFYRDSIQYRYRVRVHPIPPDGLYTSWDYNHDEVACYFNESHSDCVPVDGRNDDELNVDSVAGRPAYFDATDPRHSKPLANFNWEQVSGKGNNGSLVYMFEMKNAQAAENPLVIPYYRDDACFDDGTGDDPTPRRFPGEPSTDPRVYPPPPDGGQWPACDATDPSTWQHRQGCFGCHGVHYLVMNDTDNLFQPKPVTEIDGAQWQWAVPTETPRSVGDAYANTMKVPLQPVAVVQPVSTHEPSPSASPTDEPTPTTTATASDTATPTPSPGPAETEVEFTSNSATAGDYSDDVTFAARLTADDQPLADEIVTFDLTGADGTESITASTDQNGVASATTTLDRAPGSYQLTARYAGSEDYAPSATTTSFVIERENTTLTLEVTGRGEDRVLDVHLGDADSGRAVAGREIVFYAEGTEIGRAHTDDSGRASSRVPPRYRGAKTTYEARFEGDDYYEPSRDEEQGTSNGR